MLAVVDRSGLRVRSPAQLSCDWGSCLCWGASLVPWCRTVMWTVQCSRTLSSTPPSRRSLMGQVAKLVERVEINVSSCPTLATSVTVSTLTGVSPQCQVETTRPCELSLMAFGDHSLRLCVVFCLRSLGSSPLRMESATAECS